MEKLTEKEKEILELIKEYPTLEQEELAKRLGITRSSVAGHLARLIKKGYIQRGYLFNEQIIGIIVLGGSNVDIKGISATAFKYGSSNPGGVTKAAGGVGRNVAENLARIGLPTTLLSIIGDDPDGKWLLDYTAKAGVNIQFVEQLTDVRTGIYLSILDDNKEQVGSIAAMDIIESFSTELLRKRAHTLSAAKMVFVDANLSEAVLDYIFNYYSDKGIPIVVDPVSAKKAVKIKKYLDKVDIITPNKEETEVLTGITIDTDKDLEAAANKLFSFGVKNVVITLGSEGVFVATRDKHSFISSPKVDVVDTTGAGDAFVAGIIYGIYNEKDIFTASKYGHTMAAFTLAREETVVTNISQEILEDKMKELFIK